MIRDFIKRFVFIYIVFLFFAVLQKPIFLALCDDGAPVAPAEWLDVAINGLAMDCTVAAYLSALPGLMLTAAAAFGPGRWLRPAMTALLAFESFIVAATLTLNLGLYSYWKFPLDTTPLFYFSSSPASAMASVTATDIVGAVVVMAVYGGALFLSLRSAACRPASRQRSLRGAGVLLLLTALLFIPIRGGVTVSTMNLSRSYFSSRQMLNHAAVNPLFSLLYSATHQSDFGGEFRYFDSDAEVLSILRPVEIAADTPSVRLLDTQRPDIYLVILESFSSHLFPSLGGEAVATRIDSIASRSVMFTNLFASSFRTDRAIPAIISGFPGQPTTSVMKFASKVENLPSIPASLSDAGWKTAYYYGGDANFTNMLAYLVSCRFQKIVSDKDFPLSERTGKWGAHDHLVFRRALHDAASADPADPTPLFSVIQTSSSHEPFEVPFRSSHDSRQKNAFAYTDSCVADFIDSLAVLPRARRTLVILIPDHYGAWPRNLTDEIENHRIPMIMTGGALGGRTMRVDTIAAQTDLAATLMAQLGIDSAPFSFSHDIFNPISEKSAFFSSRTFATYADSSGFSTINIDTGDISDTDSGEPSADTATGRHRRLKATLQKLYQTLDSL